MEMLTITAYKAESCNDSDKVGTEYTAQLNPTKYKKSWKTNSVEVKQANGLNLVMVKPADPEEISLDFTIDNTGVVPGGDVDIVTNIKSLKDMCLSVNDDTHTTNYLMLRWGALELKCKMKNFDVDYTLFNTDGLPIRAIITAHFKEHLDLGTMLEGLNSPDMSHFTEVRKGDSLPLMCENIYGAPHYYLQVAEVNGIIDFRNLTPGQKILFPRLEK
jgi:hypothetical protein